MTEALVVIENGDDILDLEQILDATYFSGLELSYLQEVYKGLSEERDADTAWRWGQLLQQFAPSGGGMDLDAIGFGEDADDLNDGTSLKDPVRVATLVQSNTNRPPQILPGTFYDKLTEELVADTWDPAKKGSPRDVPGAVLVYHRSRTMFGDGKAPICWSKDGVVNKEGGLCKECPHYREISCATQMVMIWVNLDFSHIFKVNFAKTNLKRGTQLAKRLQHLKKPFGVKSDLSVTQESNNRGSWFGPSIAIDRSEKTGEWTAKALQILAEAYVTYFKSVKQGLKARHEEYKKRKTGGALGSGIPGSAGALPPAGPGVGGGAIGAGDAFGAAPGTGDAPAPPAVDVNALTGASSKK